MLVGYHRSHEASVAALDDRGRPLFAAAEERFTRVKMQGGWPRLAAEALERNVGVENARAVHGGLPLERRLLREVELALYNARHRLLQDVHPKRLRKLADVALGRTRQDEARIFPELERRHVDHHTCHAASAYYMSGFEDAEVMTCDGVGDGYSVRFFRGERGRLVPRRTYFHTAAPYGHNYEFVTTMLGFHPHRHAGKVTGLAAHGKRNDRLLSAMDAWIAEIWSASRGRPYFFMLHSTHGATKGDAHFEEAIAELRNVRKTRFGDHSDADIACAIQTILEREVTGLIERNIEVRGQPIALAGGVFANVKLNKLVKEMGFGSIFVQPAMGDVGLALGGPLQALAESDGLTPYRLEHVYLGSEFTEDEMRAAIRDAGLEPRRHDQVEAEIARLLADGRVVARFDGAMEFGPRALGNRSILYHASDPTVNDWLNKRLARTEFMPFAPATLAEDAGSSYLGLRGAEHPAEFMTITFDCSDDFKAQCGAAVHVDGTARPQLVREDRNPSFYRVLTEYKKLTGIGTVVNTSFNMHEEPIVCSPADAVRSFLQGHLDYLAIGPFVVENPKLGAVIGRPPRRNDA
jgi:carbamoyltransferase